MKLAIGVASKEDILVSFSQGLLALRGKHSCPENVDAETLVNELGQYAAKDEHLEWIVKVLLAEGSFWEDLPVLRFDENTLLLDKFEQLKSKFSAEERVLSFYTSFAQLVTAINVRLGKESDSGATRAEFDLYSALPHAITLYDSPDIRIVQIASKSGAEWWSWLWRPKGPNLRPSWCTGWTDDYHYNYYIKNGPLFVVYDKTGIIEGTPDKWQLHVSSNQFKDRNDVEVKDRKLFTTNYAFVIALRRSPFTSESIKSERRISYNGKNLLDFFSSNTENGRPFLRFDGYSIAVDLHDNCENNLPITLHKNKIKLFAMDNPLLSEQVYENLLEIEDIRARAIAYLLLTGNQFFTLFPAMDVCSILKTVCKDNYSVVEDYIASAIAPTGVGTHLTNYGFSASSLFDSVLRLNSLNKIEAVHDFTHGARNLCLDYAFSALMENVTLANDYYDRNILFYMVLDSVRLRKRYEEFSDRLAQTKAKFDVRKLLAETCLFFFNIPANFSKDFYRLLCFGLGETPAFLSLVRKLSDNEYSSLITCYRSMYKSENLAELFIELNMLRPIPFTSLVKSFALGNTVKKQTQIGFVFAELVKGVFTYANSLKMFVFLKMITENLPDKTVRRIVKKMPSNVVGRLETFMGNTRESQDPRMLALRSNLQNVCSRVSERVFSAYDAEAIFDIISDSVFSGVFCIIRDIETNNFKNGVICTAGLGSFLRISENSVSDFYDRIDYVVAQEFSKLSVTDVMTTVVQRIYNMYSYGDRLLRSKKGVVNHVIENAFDFAVHSPLVRRSADDNKMFSEFKKHSLKRAVPGTIAFKIHFDGYTDIFSLGVFLYYIFLQKLQPKELKVVHYNDGRLVNVPSNACEFTLFKHTISAEKLHPIPFSMVLIAYASDAKALVKFILAHGISVSRVDREMNLVSTIHSIVLRSLLSKYKPQVAMGIHCFGVIKAKVGDESQAWKKVFLRPERVQHIAVSEKEIQVGRNIIYSFSNINVFSSTTNLKALKSVFVETATTICLSVALSCNLSYNEYKSMVRRSLAVKAATYNSLKNA